MNQDVYVVRHHAPSQYLAALLAKIQECVLSHLGKPRLAEWARPVTMIEVFLQLRAFVSIVFDCQQMLPFPASASGHGIRHPKSDELHQPRKITMRQIPALVPTQEAQRLLFLGQRAAPAVFALHQLTEVIPFPQWHHIWLALGAPVSDPALLDTSFSPRRVGDRRSGGAAGSQPPG